MLMTPAQRAAIFAKLRGRAGALAPMPGAARPPVRLPPRPAPPAAPVPRMGMARGAPMAPPMGRPMLDLMRG